MLIPALRHKSNAFRKFLTTSRKKANSISFTVPRLKNSSLNLAAALAVPAHDMVEGYRDADGPARGELHMAISFKNTRADP
jgi:hypothetical protein